MYTTIMIIAAVIAGYNYGKTAGEIAGFDKGYETARDVYKKALSERIEGFNKLP